MERRVLAGGVATALVVVGAAVASFATDADLVPVVLGAGLVGGLVAGLVSQAPGHVGAGARAGAYGGATGFVAFVAVGTVQALLGGDLSVLAIGLEALLVALLVVPLHAILGVAGATIGVRVGRLTGGSSGDV